MTEAKENIKAYVQHGFTNTVEKGKQVVGDCPFCGKSKKFFVNPKNKRWDCKVCGREGGFSSFLDEVVENNQEYFTEQSWTALVDSRKCIRSQTFVDFNVGLNPITLQYSVPYFNDDYDKVRNIKMFDVIKGTFYGTADCSLFMFNSWNLTDGIIRIWLCEGEWDAIALQQVLFDSNLADTDIALACPGAGNFKDIWIPYFKGKEVFCCYDNDEAGKKGTGKVYVKLSSAATKLRFVHWPKNTKDKYDIRDCIIEKGTPEKFLKFIRSQFKTNPRVQAKDAIDDEPKMTISAGNPLITAEEVYKVYNKWLYMEDNGVLDVMFGAVLANRFQGENIWLFIVAPSGCLKSTLCMSISKAPMMFPVTTLTAPSLCSGMNMGPTDPSLIPQWDNHCVVVKDFTTILSLPDQQQEEIFGILRDSYDGPFDKPFGNGVIRRFDSKYGMICGVTPAIEVKDHYTAVGERFFRYTIILPQDTTEFLMRALRNANKENEMREALQDIATRTLAHSYETIPDIPVDMFERIVALAQWLAMVRGTVIRDKYTKEITHMPFQELGTRLVKQLSKLMQSIAMFKGRKEVTDYEYDLMKHVAWSSINSTMGVIIKNFYDKKNKPLNLQKIMALTEGLPKVTVERRLENLTILGCLNKGPKNTYKLTERCMILMDDSEF